MSLPRETKFLCISPLSSGQDFIEFSWDLETQVHARSHESGSYAGVMLNRSQIESLRDQLTAWLNATKD